MSTHKLLEMDLIIDLREENINDVNIKGIEVNPEEVFVNTFDERLIYYKRRKRF